ncbi:hypothetical protein [Rhodococcus sp. P1Y]|uniref:hypothetical protein n=1 Tax=Rhodococcus sp. P1Y TaxID=1302308 RepID=UPI000EAFFAA5|nr:hypothetical protein [Rhodococcus sp. P1Y]AYJ47808.1 hypothetical protein D8W71_05005 [Rhodococcus sp. P1Y]
MVSVGAWSWADKASRIGWKTVGRRVDLDGAQSWLRGPTAGSGVVRDGWLQKEADRIGGAVVPGSESDGLLHDFGALTGPEFDPDEIDPRIREFYEHTAQWRMDAWTQWTRGFGVPGSAIEYLYGKRVQQLALPVQPLAVAHGVDSEVIEIVDATGEHAGSAWLRKLRKSGDFMYSGYYRATTLPEGDGPSVHVTFPLEDGNVQVFLKPSVGEGGSLILTSPAGKFGEDGAYTVVAEKNADYASRAPIHEVFHVYVDDEGVLRTDHVLKLWGLTAVRLHYRLTPKG